MNRFESFLAQQFEDYMTYRYQLGYDTKNLRWALKTVDRYLVTQNAGPNDLTAAFFLGLQAALRTQNKSINRLLCCTRKLFEYLVRIEYCRDNPLRDIPWLPEEHFIPFIFSPPQIDELLAAVCHRLRKNSKDFAQDLGSYLAILLLARCGIKGYTQQIAAPAEDITRRRGIALDPDRFKAVVRVLVTLWIAFFLWVYIDPPGHSAYPMMAGIFALIIAMVAQASVLLLFLSWGSGIAFAGVLNIFVIPYLSGFAELAVLIFAAVFVMYYLLGKPQQTVARMFTMASFLILIGIDNQQSYSFSQYANNVVWIMLSLALAVFTAYIPTSPRPEKVFLSLLRRFFRHAEFLVSGLAPDGQRPKGITGRWRSVLYQNDLLELPGKLAAYGKQIDYRAFPDNTPEQVHTLVASLYAVAYRIKDLVEAHDYPQTELVKKRLLDDLRAWHQVIDARLQRRVEDPTQFIEPIADVRERLAARPGGLEASIAEMFAQSGKGELSTADYKNLYRLLGSYRGLSEAAIGYAQLADGINWERWQEARF